MKGPCNLRARRHALAAATARARRCGLDRIEPPGGIAAPISGILCPESNTGADLIGIRAGQGIVAARRARAVVGKITGGTA